MEDSATLRSDMSAILGLREDGVFAPSFPIFPANKSEKPRGSGQSPDLA
jgi:hypothetical protein